jgi:hypothetical protein
MASFIHVVPFHSPALRFPADHARDFGWRRTKDRVTQESIKRGSDRSNRVLRGISNNGVSCVDAIRYGNNVMNVAQTIIGSERSGCEQIALLVTNQSDDTRTLRWHLAPRHPLEEFQVATRCRPYHPAVSVALNPSK